MTEIELDDLSSSNRSKQLTSPASVFTKDADYAENTSLVIWAWVTASLLLLSSFCLVVYPRFILFVSQTPTESRSDLTPLEAYLTLHIGIWLTAAAASLTFNIPSTSPISPNGRALPTHPLLGAITCASLLTSFLSYNTSKVGALASLVSFISGVIGLWGFWVILFGGSTSISKKTGADKRTSAFIFGNKNAASAKKKEWRVQQRKSHQ